MNKYGLILAGLFIPTLMVGCGGTTTSSTGSNTSTTAGSLKVVNLQGGTTDIVGTWSDGCFFSVTAGVDQKFIKTFTATTITFKGSDFTSTNGSCSAGEVVTQQIEGSVTVTTPDPTFTGWEDATNTALLTPPTAADTSGPLLNTGPFAQMNITVTAIPVAPAGLLLAVGDTTTVDWAIDASGTLPKAYRMSNNGTAAAPTWVATTKDPESKL